MSGSGKSTLINDTLYHAVARHLHGGSAEPAPFDDIQGLEQFDKVINVDQSPIGRTRAPTRPPTPGCSPRFASCLPACRWRASAATAGALFLQRQGRRCEACQGDGMIKVEMHFLPDIYVPCDVCHGKRYNRKPWKVQVQGQEHSRSAGHDRRARAGILCRRAHGGAQAANADGRRPGLYPWGKAPPPCLAARRSG